MDEYLEESYRSWKQRQRMKGGGDVVKKKRKRMGDEEELRWAGAGAGCCLGLPGPAWVLGWLKACLLPV